MRALIEGKKVEESSSDDDAEEEEEESEDERGPEKEVPLEKQPKKTQNDKAPIIKPVEGNSQLDDTKDGLLNKVYEVEMGSEEEDEGDNEQLYEDLQKIKQK